MSPLRRPMRPSRRSPATAGDAAAFVSPRSRAPLVEDAPAKVNLTLRVLGRRPDGYHKIASFVAFATISDRLTFTPGGQFKLTMRGPTARAAGRPADNLVLKAARSLAEEIDGLTQGRFTLVKNLPVAAGLGGGSADAAAALRLLARANDLKLGDPRILRVARKIGADVSVCLDPRARMMRGIGEILSAPIRMPKFSAVLVNPGGAVSTRKVFARYDRQKSGTRSAARKHKAAMSQKFSAFIASLAAERNDLEPSATALAPAISTALAALHESAGCRLARMSGSGATCFGLYSTTRAAAAAARKIRAANPRWWVRSSTLS